MIKKKLYNEFYSDNENRIINFVALELEENIVEFKDDMFCPWCLEAKLFYRNPKNRVAHLVSIKGSEHSPDCPTNKKKNLIKAEEFEKQLQENGVDKNIFFNNLLVSLSKRYTVHKNMADMKKTLNEIDKKFSIYTKGEEKKIIRTEIDDFLVNIMEKRAKRTLYFGRIELTYANKFFTLLHPDKLDPKKVNKKLYLGGLAIKEYITKEKFENLLLGRESMLCNLICFGVIKKEGSFYNIVVDKDEDIEILEIK